MFKFITLALALTMCNAQLLGQGQTIGIGGTQYILVPVGQEATTTTLQLPYTTRQPITYSAPTTYIQSQPQIYAAPRPQIIAAPAPRPVVLQAPRPVVLQNEEISGPPQPYQFGYQSTDEQGNTLSRSETADGSGTVTGSYSYTDAQGLNRVVEYVADAAGYRATVKTNEPGTANANPADVQIQASEPPANVQQTVAAYSQPRAQKARSQ